MTNQKLSESQDKIIAKFVVILAKNEGYSINEENAMRFNTSNIIIWRNTARSLFDALTEVIDV